jgi:hypothetical protein
MSDLLIIFNGWTWLGPVLYLDPGSGSYIFQLLIAGIVGAIFIIRVYWKRILGFFSKQKPEDEEHTTDEDR